MASCVLEIINTIFFLMLLMKEKRTAKFAHLLLTLRYKICTWYLPNSRVKISNTTTRVFYVKRLCVWRTKCSRMLGSPCRVTNDFKYEFIKILMSFKCIFLVICFDIFYFATTQVMSTNDDNGRIFVLPWFRRRVFTIKLNIELLIKSKVSNIYGFSLQNYLSLLKAIFI